MGQGVGGPLDSGAHFLGARVGLAGTRPAAPEGHGPEPVEGLRVSSEVEGLTAPRPSEAGAEQVQGTCGH
jgi:hypothetical protein